MRELCVFLASRSNRVESGVKVGERTGVIHVRSYQYTTVLQFAVKGLDSMVHRSSLIC